jgi:hypothetical protein
MCGSNFHVATWYLAQRVALLLGLVEQITVKETQNHWKQYIITNYMLNEKINAYYDHKISVFWNTSFNKQLNITAYLTAC